MNSPFRLFDGRPQHPLINAQYAEPEQTVSNSVDVLSGIVPPQIPNTVGTLVLSAEVTPTISGGLDEYFAIGLRRPSDGLWFAGGGVEIAGVWNRGTVLYDGTLVSLFAASASGNPNGIRGWVEYACRGYQASGSGELGLVSGGLRFSGESDGSERIHSSSRSTVRLNGTDPVEIVGIASDETSVIFHRVYLYWVPSQVNL